MEEDSEKTKISYFHHWINGEGMRHIESWKNSKTLISQSAYDELETKEGKYSSECIASYFTLFELLLAPKSNPLLAVEDLHFTTQGSMTSGEFHSHIVKIVKICQFPNPEAEERAIRDAIFLGMNSQWARDKAINLMNEEAKELTVDSLMNQLAIEDCNTQHKILSQLSSSSSTNFAAYDHRQNKGKSNKSKHTSGKNVVPRKVPIHLETAFKEEIESLVKQGILEEVKEHTDWVNSYVIVKKDTGNHHSPNHTVKKKLRICLDPRDLNEALQREPYHTRSVDEITAKLQGMTVFTIVDFKNGYWMVVLHPDSRKLTCMALPFGRFQWT